MGYISKYDKNFVTFLNQKYREYCVQFLCFDDYILWLYYDFCKKNEDKYYSLLEKDMWEYSDSQTGSAREIEKRRDSLCNAILKVMKNNEKQK